MRNFVRRRLLRCVTVWRGVGRLGNQDLGETIPDVLFKTDSVLAITVESDDYHEGDFYSWRR
jgi:hypothetical protein